jgi:hypothetical protein
MTGSCTHEPTVLEEVALVTGGAVTLRSGAGVSLPAGALLNSGCPDPCPVLVSPLTSAATAAVAEQIAANTLWEDVAVVAGVLDLEPSGIRFAKPVTVVRPTLRPNCAKHLLLPVRTHVWDLLARARAQCMKTQSSVNGSKAEIYQIDVRPSRPVPLALFPPACACAPQAAQAAPDAGRGEWQSRPTHFWSFQQSNADGIPRPTGHFSNSMLMVFRVPPRAERGLGDHRRQEAGRLFQCRDTSGTCPAHCRRARASSQQSGSAASVASLQNCFLSSTLLYSALLCSPPSLSSLFPGCWCHRAHPRACHAQLCFKTSSFSRYVAITRAGAGGLVGLNILDSSEPYNYDWVRPATSPPRAFHRAYSVSEPPPALYTELTVLPDSRTLQRAPRGVSVPGGA